MKKLTWLCLSPLVLASLAFAGGQNAPAYAHEGRPHHPHHPHHHTDRPFTGVYVMGAMGGMIAGLDTTQASGSTMLFTPDPFEPILDIFELASTNDADLFQSNVVGQLGVGYAYQFANGFVLGAFATVGATDIDLVNTTTDLSNETTLAEEGVGGFYSLSSVTQLKTEIDYDFALLIKPGFTIGKRTLLYGLLGPRWGHFNTSYRTSLDIDFDIEEGEEAELSILSDLGADGHATQYAIGFTAGVGIAQLITSHLMLGLEYTYTGYGAFDPINVDASTEVPACIFSVEGPEGCISTPLAVAGSATIEPNINTVMATLSYRFH